jgi:hypothetical protein
MRMHTYGMLPRLVAVAAMVASLLSGSAVFAGTTGALTGRVVLTDGAPVAGAKVTAASPTETVTAITDARGAFAFVALAPDTYTVTAAKIGIQTQQEYGITVTADNTHTIVITTIASVRTLDTVTTRATAGLVRPGTTSDVYSVNAAMQSKVKALGGGGDLDQAYSAIASVPGVVLSPGQNGWNQNIYIRGGDAYQVGYELDGVPVLRTYDNYPTTNASTIGQSELQVYTGAAPATSESQGLAGYINQVIKTGTYPGTASLDLGLGAPTMYNKADLEIGGATPNRLFSYFAAVGVMNQNYRAIDASNGDDITQKWGSPWDEVPCPSTGTSLDWNYVSCYANGSAGPGGYVLGPYSIATTSQIQDRENIVNLHFGIPHRKDEGRDDVQLLYDVSQLYNQFYSSATDWGIPLINQNYVFNSAFPAFYYYGGYFYHGPVGQNFNFAINPATGNPFYVDQTTRYNFPGQPSAAPGNLIPLNKRDQNSHGQALAKLQYQHNFSSSAYLKIYGYDYYSDWFQNGFDSYFTTYVGCCSSDYELNNHTHGFSATFGDQLNDKHLLSVQAALMSAVDLRVNNKTVSNRSFPIAYLVSAANPTNGVCYDGSGNAVSCYGNAFTATAHDAFNGAVADPSDPSQVGTCNGPCTWYVTDHGLTGGYNHGRPVFTSGSITDQFKPSDKWLFDYGLRFDRFSFKGGDTTGLPTRAFFFKAWNIGECVPTLPGSLPQPKPGDPSLPCMDPSNFGGPGNPNNPGALTFVPAILTNKPNDVQTYSYVEPRFGGTFAVNPDNVIRFNYGLYVESPSTAYEQYDSQQQDLPGFDGPNFYGFGFKTTSHPVAPEQSYNLDASWEHHFAGTDMSFKLTPYLRKTKDQIENFVLEQKTGFISGFNAGNQTADGVEFALSKGDFSRNGFAFDFSYTYTHSFIKFQTLPNGGTVLDSINLAIGGYNAYTSKCAGVNTLLCGGGKDSIGNTSAACYTPGGTADPTCAAGDIANPYWNAPPQPLFDPKGSYSPFSTIPGSFQSGDNSFITPNVASIVLNYKHDKFSITPSIQYFSGNYYGAPLETPGIDPALGCNPLASGSVSGDPRYPYGAPGGAPYDATSCLGLLSSPGGMESIPNPYTHKFDAPGAFLSPNQILGHVQMSYDVTPRVSLQLNLVNVFSTCFGGTKEAWTVYGDKKACGYISSGYGLLTPVGNSYNPGVTFQPIVQYPYMPWFGSTSPFGAYLDVKFKL